MIKVDYKNFLLAMLVLAGVVTTFERFVFSLALEPIKHELQLSDSQLGLMTGIAFAAFYAIAGIPIARWADRGNRVTITALAVGLSGAMVSLCGTVSSFSQLLLIRAGVAVGESGIMPTGQSLLPDYFDRAERPFATAIYFSFYSISMIVGYLLGGWLIESYGWRTTFMVMGLPGIAVAITFKLTINEPRLSRSKSQCIQPPPLVESFRVLWQQKTFRQLFLSFCVAYFFSMGVSQWLAVFLIRSHDMSSSEVGAWLALSFGIFGTIGTYLGGYYASRFAHRKEKLQMRALACVIICYGFASVLAYLSPNKYISLTFIGVSAIAGTFGNGPIFAALQSLVDENIRSVAIAITFMAANLIGFGLGPLVLGIVSDLLYPIFQQESLRYALVIFSPGTLWVALHYWKAGNTIEGDIKLVESKANSLAFKAIDSN